MANQVEALGLSEQLLMDEVFKLSDAGGSLIQVRSREVMRTVVTLRKAILAEDTHTYKEWDMIHGFRNFTLENFTDHRKTGDNNGDAMDALRLPLSDLSNPNSEYMVRPNHMHYVVFIDMHPHIRDNPYAVELLQQYAAILPSSNVCLLLVTPDVTLDGLPLGTVLVTDAPTPTEEELVACMEKMLDQCADQWEVASDISEDDLHALAVLGLGMTKYEFETYASIAIVEASIRGDETITLESLSEGIAKGKTEVVKQSDILELFHTEKMEDVGGMQRLKDWVEARADNFSDEAKQFGIEPPKGIAIIGVPGTGKSLVAKAIAATMRVPLIRLDFGRVFSKFIGDSESRMRSALSMVQSMGNLVLFADEIDKGLGGINGGGGDAGTSSRVLGAFLTWMQENRSNVFVIMTANRIEGLPPELFRKGRLDAIFSVGLPTEEERVEVLAVHLRKRGRSIKAFSEVEIQRFLAASVGYVPAEIEAAVKDGLVQAWAQRADDLTMDHIIAALGESVPMSTSHAEHIARIVDWASKNATPVNYPERAVAVADDSRRVARTPRSRRNMH